MKFTIYDLRAVAGTARMASGAATDVAARVERAERRAKVCSNEIAPLNAARTAQRAVPTTLQRGFTLIEMLAVIAIIGIIAVLSVPVIKNFGQSNVSASASRQLVDDIGRARQLAMSDRTTVYMVFLPTNFWTTAGSPTVLNSTWYGNLTTPQLQVFSNLLDKQLTGYTYLAYGALGDQPGRHTWHYLTPWQSLPEGSFIPMWKFYDPAGALGGQQALSFNDPANNNYTFNIYPFSYTNTFPFPTEDSTNPAYYTGSTPDLPYIAFNYLGQLSDYSGNMLSSSAQTAGQDYDFDFAGGGVDIPLAQGSVIPTKDHDTRVPVPFVGTAPGKIASPGVIEMPPGNSTNIAYTVVHIDPLTGRATLEYHKMQ